MLRQGCDVAEARLAMLAVMVLALPLVLELQNKLAVEAFIGGEGGDGGDLSAVRDRMNDMSGP